MYTNVYGNLRSKDWVECVWHVVTLVVDRLLPQFNAHIGIRLNHITMITFPQQY